MKYLMVLFSLFTLSSHSHARTQVIRIHDSHDPVIGNTIKFVGDGGRAGPFQVADVIKFINWSSWDCQMLTVEGEVLSAYLFANGRGAKPPENNWAYLIEQPVGTKIKFRCSSLPDTIETMEVVE